MRLYNESRFVKIITKDDLSNNYSMYGTERDISCFMLDEYDFILE